MSTEVTELPTWFLVVNLNHTTQYYDKDRPFEVRVHDVKSLPRYRAKSRYKFNQSSYGGTFATKAEAVAHGESKGWIQVKSWNEARELAAPTFAALDAHREAEHEADEPQGGSGRHGPGGPGPQSQWQLGAAFRDPEVRDALLALLGPGDEHGVVRELTR